MLGTSMPKAAINEHCQLLLREGNVNRTSGVTRHWVMNAIPQARPMKQTAQLELWGGVFRELLPQSCRMVGSGYHQRLPGLSATVNSYQVGRVPSHGCRQRDGHAIRDLQQH